MWVIYKRTNLINNKVYIGQTKNAPKIRWAAENNGDQAIGKAIQKYGINNFQNEIIDRAESQEEANSKEVYWIKYYNSIDQNEGYNKKLGGANVTPSRSRLSKPIVLIEECKIFRSPQQLANYLGIKKTEILMHTAQELYNPRYSDGKSHWIIYWKEFHLQEERFQGQVSVIPSNLLINCYNLD